MTDSKIRNWNPKKGDALQGDIILFQIPDNIEFSRKEEIQPDNGRLILAEGEITGHHHAIWMTGPVMFREDGSGSGGISMDDTNAMLAQATKSKKEVKSGTAKLYRDPEAIQALVREGELTTADLAIGILEVTDGPVLLSHDEHDAIRIPPGKYYVGNQQEWSAAEARKVAD